MLVSPSEIIVVMFASFCVFSYSVLRLSGGVYETEDVVEDVVVAISGGQELEGLAVAHGPTLLLDLCGDIVSLVFAV